jgi:uncharacterized protein (TIGR02147 family)
MVDLFSYTDYCAYLRDYYNERRSRYPFVSYRFLGMKVGLDAGNLVKIMQGKRHLSSAGVERFIDYARFSNREARYFETLVQFKKAKREQDNKALFEKLMAIQRIDPTRIEPMQYEFYREWYHTAILALLHVDTFKDDYRAIATSINPPVTVKQAKESCELLLRLDLVRREDDGTLVPTNSMITTGEQWKSLAIRSFQEQSIKLAGEAFNRYPSEERDISTVTIAVSPEDFEEIRRVTNEYRRSVLQIASASDDADRVYQLNIQLFPLSVRKS